MVVMNVSYRVDSDLRIGHLVCAPAGDLEDLERALLALLGQVEFEASFGILLELGSGATLLSPLRALGTADLFATQGRRLHGPVAVCTVGLEASSAGRLIAILGRYRGLRMEAFQDRPRALQWLAAQHTPAVAAPRRTRGSRRPPYHDRVASRWQASTPHLYP